MQNKIAIFGSGLSAAYVLAAVKFAGFEAEIFSDTPPKYSGLGHILLREVPPETFSVSASLVTFFSIGTREAYLARMKRFEERHASKTAFPDSGRHELIAYSPERVLKELLPPEISITIKTFSDDEIIERSKSFLWTFVTFPFYSSIEPEKFVEYWTVTAKTIKLDMPNYAIYNGTNLLPWTRYTCYWGTERWEFSHLEFPVEEEAPMYGAVKARDIAPGVKEYFSLFPRVTLVGRWARWNKAVLAHEAYEQALKILQTL